MFWRFINHRNEKKKQKKKTKNKKRGDGRNYLGSEPNYHTTKCSGDLLTIEMKTKNQKKNKKQEKQQVFRNKSLSLGLSMIELNKKVFYEFWYDYIKPKYGEKTKLCGIDTDSFIVYVKIANFTKTLQ